MPPGIQAFSTGNLGIWHRELWQIAAIYDAYQKVFPKRREKQLELEEDGEYQSSKEETKKTTNLFEGIVEDNS